MKVVVKKKAGKTVLTGLLFYHVLSRSPAFSTFFVMPGQSYPPQC